MKQNTLHQGEIIMRTEQLEYFLEIAKTGSMNTARTHLLLSLPL